MPKAKKKTTKKVKPDLPSTRKSASGVGMYGSTILGEEYLAALKWPLCIPVYQKMTRPDGQVNGIIRGFVLPLMRSNWSIDGEEGDAVTEYSHDFVFTWPTVPWVRTVERIAMGMLGFGHYVGEEVYYRDKDQVRLAELAEILQSSILEWVTDDDNTLLGVKQSAYWGRKIRTETIDAKHLTLFTFNQEGDDPTGVPLTRSMYQHWWYKTLAYKIDMMKNERWGAGVPVGKMGPDDGEDEVALMEGALEDLRAHHKLHVIISNDQEVSFQGITGTLPDVLASATHHNEEMGKSALMQFLNYGTTQTGARALGESSQDFLIMSLQALGDYIADEFNKQVLWPAQDATFETVPDPRPKLTAGDMSNVDLGMLSEALQKLGTGGFIKARPKYDEPYLRKIGRLPEIPQEELEIKIEDGPKTPEPVQPTGKADEEATESASGTETVPDEEKVAAQRESGNRALYGPEVFCDMGGIADWLQTATEDTVEALQPHRETLIAQIADMAVTLSPQQMLNRGPVMGEDAERIMFTALHDASRFGATSVKRELDKQGQTADQSMMHKVWAFFTKFIAQDAGRGLGVNPDSFDSQSLGAAFAPLFGSQSELDEMLLSQAELILLNEATRLTQAASMLKAEARTLITGVSLFELIVQRLNDMSLGMFQRGIGSQIDNAHIRGRTLGANEYVAEGGEIERAMYSAVRDTNLCLNCAPLDRQFHALNDPQYITPNPNCIGGLDCRCWTIMVKKKGE
jgi:hypothetical protein